MALQDKYKDIYGTAFINIICQLRPVGRFVIIGEIYRSFNVK